MRYLLVADIHINTRKDQEFEVRRISELAESLPGGYHVVLLGDTLDRNDPLPMDYALLHSLLNTLQQKSISVTIIAGNHDYKAIQNLWHPGVHIALNADYYEHLDAFIIPWDRLNHVHSITKTDKICFSHARCTIPPFITEEVDLSIFSDRFSLVILGDIHTPYNPYPNIHYTSSPSQLEYTTYNADHGYLTIVNDTLEFHRLDLPSRRKVILSNPSELPKDPDSRHLFKYVIPIEGDEGRKLKNRLKANQKVELVQKVEVDVEETNNTLQEFMKSKLSVKDLLFSSLPNVDQKILNNIRGRL